MTPDTSICACQVSFFAHRNLQNNVTNERKKKKTKEICNKKVKNARKNSKLKKTGDMNNTCFCGDTNHKN